MTDHLQPGLFQSAAHPDADQLSAFAEDALPAHDREATLLHLATCARCREILALSLPPLEQPAAEPSVPLAAAKPRAAWSAGWRLWLPTSALAVAALVVLALHVHQTQRAATPPQPNETASVSAAPPQFPQTPAARQPTANAPEPARGAKAAPPNIAGALEPPTPAATMGMAGGTDMTSAASQFNAPPQYSPIFRLRSEPKVPAAHQVTGAFHGQANARGQVGMGASAMAAGASSDDAVGGTGQTIPQGQQQAELQSLPQAQRQQQGAAAPQQQQLNAGQPPRYTVNGTNVDSTTYASASAASLGALAPAPAAPSTSLPSHLAVAATAAQGSRTLALDTAGALFLSLDAGQHWTAVHAPWKGSAASLVRTSYAAGTASITGLITDSTGAIIPGAVVTFVDTRSHITLANVTADRAGRYTVANLGPGAYTISISAAGFITSDTTASLTANQKLALDRRLQVANVSATVEVSSDAAQIEVASALPASADKASRKEAKRKAAQPLPPLFEVTTASGEHWISADGATWTRSH